MFTDDFDRYYEYFDMLVQFCDSMYKKMYKQSRIEDAKDIVQDCYLKAFLNFVDGDFLQYMKTLIKNQFINEQKKMKFIEIEDI